MLDDEVHFLLMRAFNSSNRAVVERTGAMGLLPGQPKVLEYLSEHDGSRATDICAGCVLDKSTMTSLLSRMETAGLIERRRSETDGRASMVWLTAHGAEIARLMRESIAGVDDAAMEALGKEDYRRLAALLRRATVAFDRCKTGHGPERPAVRRHTTVTSAPADDIPVDVSSVDGAPEDAAGTESDVRTASPDDAPAASGERHDNHDGERSNKQ